ncbi:MAG: hypothetical protein J0H31_29530, partial [Alphaproteobacteria bacterium]|nr:hypothetical protein [Alphaproteobacteria bacterium]
MPVNPATANIAVNSGLGSHAQNACNFIAPFFKCEEESDGLAAVFPACFVQKGGLNRTISGKTRNQPVNDNEERPVTIITGR